MEQGWWAGPQENPWWRDVMLANAEQQAKEFNSSWFSQLVNDAGAEAGGKIGASAQSLARALMLPGDVATGQTPFDPRSGLSGQDPATLDRAAELSGSIGLSSLPLPKPTNSLGMFGGRMAKTADLDALERANRLWDEGYPNEDIYRETGWFRGADEQWRFEIDDSAAKINHTAAALGGAAPERTVPLSNALQHEALYAAYPELGNISTTMRMEAGQTGGYYAPPRTVGNRLIEGIGVEAPTRNDLRSVTLHEAQHAIQERERFAQGASGETFTQQADAEVAAEALAWRREIARKRQEMPNASDREIDAAIVADYAEMGAPEWVPPAEARSVAFDFTGNPDAQLQEVVNIYGLDKKTTPHTPRQLYERTAGEVESRNVQTRMNMTPAQRKAQAPWLTQDVPESQQIIRMRGL